MPQWNPLSVALTSQILLRLMLGLGAIALIRDTMENGHDFTVFWNAARAVLHGEPLYSLERDGGMVYKYPPWSIPLFFPFAALPLQSAKLVWGLLEVASLAWVIRWIQRFTTTRTPTLFIVVVTYWGLWAVHALDGQVVLLLLAGALWSWSPDGFEKSRIRSGLLVFLLSTKIFTLLPLVSFRLRKKNRRTLLLIGLALVTLSTPAWLTQGEKPSLLEAWSRAATSGGALLTSEQIRGRHNPSLTRWVLSHLHVPAEKAALDSAVACALALVLGFVWSKASARMKPFEAWIGWLALTPVIHPLPWWHLFIFSFPLAAVSLEACLPTRGSKRSWGALTCVGLGIFLICGATEKLLGPLGVFLEQECAKSWGVLLCAGMLALQASWREPALEVAVCTEGVDSKA
ncbi:MAG: glycosyltransferase 87 family protein [Bdellovibrionia bacterium]